LSDDPDGSCVFDRRFDKDLFGRLATLEILRKGVAAALDLEWHRSCRANRHERPPRRFHKLWPTFIKCVMTDISRRGEGAFVAYFVNTWIKSEQTSQIQFVVTLRNQTWYRYPNGFVRRPALLEGKGAEAFPLQSVTRTICFFENSLGLHEIWIERPDPTWVGYSLAVLIPSGRGSGWIGGDILCV
jgi:hypothetical protein